LKDSQTSNQGKYRFEPTKSLFVKSAGTNFTAASSQVNQDFWIRYWLQQGAFKPDSECEVANSASCSWQSGKQGTMDALVPEILFHCIVTDKVGFIAALTAEMWKNHPEEYFMMCRLG